MNVKIFSCPFVLSKLSKIFIFRGQLCENYSVFFFFPFSIWVRKQSNIFFFTIHVDDGMVSTPEWFFILSEPQQHTQKSELLIIWIKWIHKLGLCTVYLHSETVSATNLNYSSYSFKSWVAVIKFIFLYRLHGEDADTKWNWTWINVVLSVILHDTSQDV